jgi:purine-binding chemotaxis protein CheW
MNETMAMTGERVAEAEDVIQLVGFRIADELFGVDILMVQEIIKDITITAIPDSPEFIKGVINLRGNIIPIIDLHKRLKLAESKKSPQKNIWIIILNINARITGFIVDDVTRVLKVPINAIEPPPDMVSSGLKSDYINGVCQLDEKRLLAILDFNKILIVEEFKKLGQLKRQGKI